MATPSVEARPLNDLLDKSYGILDAASREYDPEVVYGLFSGGHDSLCATTLASRSPRFAAAVHINTGIGVRQTREFVRQTCAEQRWPLIELSPPPFTPGRCPGHRTREGRRTPWADCPACAAKRRPGIDYESLPAYEAIVRHLGFPGPAGHALVYRHLKERCLRQLRRDTFGPKRRRWQVMLLVGGMRADESVRRMGHAKAMHVEWDEGRAWASPIVNWTSADKERYLAATGLSRNPVVGKLCMSGECLCGAFARPEEFAEVSAAYPEAAAEIERLQALARGAGVPCVWGKRPRGREKKEKACRGHGRQKDLFGLCWSCQQKVEE